MELMRMPAIRKREKIRMFFISIEFANKITLYSRPVSAEKNKVSQRVINIIS
jgi:hypothetical protein